MKSDDVRTVQFWPPFVPRAHPPYARCGWDNSVAPTIGHRVLQCSNAMDLKTANLWNQDQASKPCIELMHMIYRQTSIFGLVLLVFKYHLGKRKLQFCQESLGIKFEL